VYVNARVAASFMKTGDLLHLCSDVFGRHQTTPPPPPPPKNPPGGGGAGKKWEKLYTTAVIIQKAGRWMDEQRGKTGWTEMGTLTECDKTVTHRGIQVCTQNFSLARGGGALPEAIYNLCFILKITL
jgi:hypothetical protein